MGWSSKELGVAWKNHSLKRKKVNNPTKKWDMRWKSWNSSHFFWDEFCNNQNSTFLSGHFSIGRGLWKIKGWWERQDLTSWFLALTQEVKASLRRSYDSLIGQEGLGRALSVGAAQGRGFEAFSGLSQTNLKEAWWPLKNLSMVSQMSFERILHQFGWSDVLPLQEERKRSNSSCSLLWKLSFAWFEQFGIFEGILSPFEIGSKKRVSHEPPS